MCWVVTFPKVFLHFNTAPENRPRPTETPSRHSVASSQREATTGRRTRRFLNAKTSDSDSGLKIHRLYTNRLKTASSIQKERRAEVLIVITARMFAGPRVSTTVASSLEIKLSLKYTPPSSNFPFDCVAALDGSSRGQQPVIQSFIHSFMPLSSWQSWWNKNRKRRRGGRCLVEAISHNHAVP